MSQQTQRVLDERDTQIAEVLASRESMSIEYETTVRDLREQLEAAQELVDLQIDNY
jgi:hypothetical protein